VVPIFGLYAARAVLSHVGAVRMSPEILSESIRFISFWRLRGVVRTSIEAAAPPTTLQVRGAYCRRQPGPRLAVEGLRRGQQGVT
jgi:hypothetical protein